MLSGNLTNSFLRQAPFRTDSNSRHFHLLIIRPRDRDRYRVVPACDSTWYCYMKGMKRPVDIIRRHLSTVLRSLRSLPTRRITRVFHRLLRPSRTSFTRTLHIFIRTTLAASTRIRHLTNRPGSIHKRSSQLLQSRQVGTRTRTKILSRSFLSSSKINITLNTDKVGGHRTTDSLHESNTLINLPIHGGCLCPDFRISRSGTHIRPIITSIGQLLNTSSSP